MVSEENFQPRKTIRSYSLGDETLLFDENKGQLLRINATAEAIWKGCQAGLSSKDIIDTLWRVTGVEIERISNDVMRILSKWQAMGIFGTTSHLKKRILVQDQGGSGFQTGGALAYVEDLKPGANKDIGPKDFFEMAYSCRFKMIDTCFYLQVSTKKQWEYIMPMYAHLPAPAQAPDETKLTIVPKKDLFFLLYDGLILDWCENLAGIAPMVHGNSLLLAYELSRCLFGLHAAAVVYNNQSILMPAISGSGKSTLTAALVGSGFQYCADDLVSLTPAPIRMRPVPVAIGLKSGSWPLLRSYHAHIASLPTHIRIDGKHIRYLVPSTQALCLSGGLSFAVDYIVFPQYESNLQGSVLTPMNPADGLCRLTAAGYDLHGPLTAEIVDRMVEWISGIPCYELRFRNLDHAVSVLKTLVKS